MEHPLLPVQLAAGASNTINTINSINIKGSSNSSGGNAASRLTSPRGTGVVLSGGRVIISRPPRTPRDPTAVPLSLSEAAKASTGAEGGGVVASGGPSNDDTQLSPATATATIVTTTGSIQPRCGRRRKRRHTRRASASGTTRPVANLSATTTTASAAFLAVLWRDLFPALVAVYLTVPQVAVVGAVCRAARRAAGQPFLWRRIAASHFAVLPLAVEAMVCRTTTTTTTSNGSGCHGVSSHVPRTIAGWRAGRDLPFSSAEDAEVAATMDGTASPLPLPPAATPVTARYPIPDDDDDDDDGGGEDGDEEVEGRESGLLLLGLDSQLPTPCERGGSSPARSEPATAPVAVCQAPSPLEANTMAGTRGGECSLNAPAFCPAALLNRGSCGCDGGGASTAVFLSSHSPLMAHPLSLRQAPATTAATTTASFPWQSYVRFLHRSRVGNFLALLNRQEGLPIRSSLSTAEDCRQRVRRLTYTVNVLCQREAGQALAPELVARLAAALAERGRLLLLHSTATETEGSGPAQLCAAASLDLRRLAVEDLAAAEALSGASGDDAGLTRAIASSNHNDINDEDGGGGGFCSWAAGIADFDAAAGGPRPLAALAALRRLRCPRDGGDVGGEKEGEAEAVASDDHHHDHQRRHRTVVSLVMSYLLIHATLGVAARHLLVRAAAAASTPQERLLVQALERLSRPDSSPDATAAAAAAGGYLDLALSLLPSGERAALRETAQQWCAWWVLEPQVTLESMVAIGLAHHGDDGTGDNSSGSTLPSSSSSSSSSAAAGVIAAMPPARLAVISIIYHVMSLLPCTPGHTTASPTAATAATASGGPTATRTGIVVGQGSAISSPCEALMHHLAVSRSRRSQAAALTRLAALYSRAAALSREGEEEGEGEEEEGMALALVLALPMPADTTGAAVALRLLHTAAHVAPGSVAAHLALAHLYSQQEGEGVVLSDRGLPHLHSTAYDILSQCLHHYAVPYTPTAAVTTVAAVVNDGEGDENYGGSALGPPPLPSYLRRRERSPYVCFIPAELLTARSRVTKSSSGSGGAAAAAALALLHPGPPAATTTTTARVSHRSLADVYEAAAHDPRRPYPRHLRAAIALDAATRAASPASPSTHLLLLAAADKEMAAAVALSLSERDVALRLRFLTDSLAHINDIGNGNDNANEEARAEARRQAGLLALLLAGRGADPSDPAAAAAGRRPRWFPVLAARDVADGLAAFTGHLQRTSTTTTTTTATAATAAVGSLTRPSRV